MAWIHWGSPMARPGLCVRSAAQGVERIVFLHPCCGPAIQAPGLPADPHRKELDQELRGGFLTMIRTGRTAGNSTPGCTFFPGDSRRSPWSMYVGPWQTRRRPSSLSCQH